MKVARALAGGALVATLVLVSSDGLLSQDKKDSRLKGQLPPGWSKLDLTAAQKEDIYRLNAEYKAKTDKLNDEIRQLQSELSRKRISVLTEEQRKKLVDLVVPETGKEKAKEKAKEKTRGKDADK